MSATLEMRPIGPSGLVRLETADPRLTTDYARRRGVGSALMAHCEAVHDADRIFTSTNESNEPMRALLAKAGWLPAGVVHYLDTGDPELIFVKPRG